MSLIQMLLGAASDVIKDLYYNYVTLLLHGDGTNAAQNNTFLDSSSNAFTVTRNGNTTQGAFSPFSVSDGYWSNYFGGSQSINAPASTDFQFTGDFTIEAWLYPTNTGDKSLIVQNSGSNYLALNVNAGTGFNIYLNSSGPSISPTDIIPQVNQWNHIALVRSGSTVKVYLNGKASGTTATNSSTLGYNLAFYVGALGTQSSGSMIGYISNARVVNGTAVYTSNFTPSTSPLTAITNTKLLTCQSNRFKDNSTNAYSMSVSGSPSVQIFAPFATSSPYSASVNGGSMYFDGSGDYLTVPNNTVFQFGTGDFTIEGWFYYGITYPGGYYTLFTIGNYTDGILMRVQNTSDSLYFAGGYTNWGGTTYMIPRSWNHIALVKQSGTVKVYVNGTSVLSFSNSSNLQPAGSVYVGTSAHSLGDVWNGYISNFRIVKGTAVYTSNFIPPTTPLTAITNTQLLLSGTNGGIFDNASSNDLETIGNAQISTTQSKFGTASMYFNGTASYVTLANNPVLSLGDFTIEGWFYSATAASTYQSLFSFGGNSSLSSVGAILLMLGNSSNSTNTGQVSLLVSTDGANFQINTQSSAGVISNNTWTHFAITRIGGTFIVYINGNSVIISTSIAATTSLYAGTVNRIGAIAYSGLYYTGYIDDFRVTTGIARYPYNFTRPLIAYYDSGYSTYTPPTTDSYFGQTTLLLHGDGTNGAQNNTFLDSSPNALTITRNGNATQGTFTPFSRAEGYWSNYFNGSSDYLSVANNAALNLGTGDFTIEAWIYPISVNSGNANPVISQLTGASNTGWLFGISSTSLWQFSTGSSVIVRAGNVALNQWTHLAAVRISGTTTLYVNGSSVGSTSSSFNFSDTASLLIGYQSSFVYTNCYVSNARIIKGTGAYTSNFTPPTLPLTAITNTSLLTCQSNRFKDNSSNAFTITLSGSPSVQPFIPFEPTTAYSTSLVGGSAYFDGSGDYLNTGTSGQFTASGDFTVSCWFYLQSFSASYYAVAGNWSAGTSDEWLIQIANDGSIRFLTSADGTFSSAGVVKLNQWMYFTATRSGTTVTVQVNGTTIRTYAKSDTLGSATKSINIGQQPGNNWPWNGYIADFRLVSGSAITTIPTAPASSSGTSLLLSCTNASIIDSAASIDFETSGTAQVSTSQSKFGGASMYFDGTNSYVLSSPTQNFALGSGDFTVEYWLYLNSTAYQQTVMGFGDQNSAYNALFGWTENGKLVLYLSSAASSWDIANAVTIIPASLSTAQWYHVAVTRYGSTFRTFCNGNQQATFTSSASIYQPANKVCFGRYATGYNINAYIEDFRFTKGISRYNYNFTIPSSAYPDK